MRLSYPTISLPFSGNIQTMKVTFLFALFTLYISVNAYSEPIDYEKDIAPILKENCLECHGPKKNKSNLRVDQRASLLIGGDAGIPSLVPGNVKDSYFLEVILGEDEDMRMPPKGDLLTSKEIKTLEKWVEEGAEWPGQMNQVTKEVTSDHWSFQPVKRPTVPNKNINPVDAFLNVKLKESGLHMNAEAAPKDLIKRVSVILTGLLPSYEQVLNFEKAYQQNPKHAYENLVDDLLASKHFGERWSQHWLDVIRWAETNGSESNLYRVNAWVYRDYLINAFNSDKPYDQFIKEQIAGDTMGQGEALGFLVAGPHVPAATVGREPTAIRQATADRRDEIMQTVGASMMGVTVGCARCHNHKFDPVSIKDYYSMTAVFNDIEFGSRIAELDDSHPRAKKEKTISKGLNEIRNEFSKEGAWVEDWISYEDVFFNSQKTKSIRFEFMNNSVSLDEVEVYGLETKEINLAHKSKGTLAKGPTEMMEHSRSSADVVNDGQYGTMTFKAKVEKGKKGKPWLELTFDKSVSINQVRLSINREYTREVDYLAGYKKPSIQDYRLKVASRDGSWKEVAFTRHLKKLKGEKGEMQKKLQTKITEMINDGPRLSFTGHFVEPTVSYVLHRGSPENPKSEVFPAAPLVLNGDLNLSSDTPGQKRRVEFANWISSEENPLTARVMANRIWHHIFGAGIVRTTSDFGLAGTLPTHPKLLDWLSSEFVNPTVSDSNKWSMKAFIKLLVTSKAFKQSSSPNEKSIKVDGGSQLLWRFPPRRVTAEVIRDGILLASHSLNKKIGGISYRIHNVKKTYSQWKVIDNFKEATWRRMIYQERMRRVDDKMFTAFDFPDCGQVRDKRPVSTTPLQALNLMNSEFVIDQSNLISKLAESSSDKPAEIINKCFQLILQRNPDAEERKSGIAVMKNAGLELVCRSMLNSNEFAFLP